MFKYFLSKFIPFFTLPRKVLFVEKYSTSLSSERAFLYEDIAHTR